MISPHQRPPHSPPIPELQLLFKAECWAAIYGLGSVVKASTQELQEAGLQLETPAPTPSGHDESEVPEPSPIEAEDPSIIYSFGSSV